MSARPATPPRSDGPAAQRDARPAPQTVSTVQKNASMSLSGKVLSAVKSNYVGMLARVAAQLVAQIAIMRLLGPDLVGTFGYVLLLNGVLALVVDQGFGWSLIQGDFDDDEVAVAYTRMMLAGAVAGALVFAVSYPIAQALANPLAGEVIRWSAPAYLLIGLYCVSHARLRRDLRFRELQYATTGAYVIAYPGVGLAMALAGCGVWSLLGAWYAQALLQIVIGHRYASHSLRFAKPWRSCRAGTLGRQVAGINVLNWAVDSSSGVIVGGMGAAALGNFNAASVLARQPALQLVQTLQGLLFSTASAVDGDAAKVRRLYLSALAVIGLVVGPLYGYFLAHADLLVGLVFGQKWIAAGAVLAALSLGMVAMALSTVTSSVLTATGGQGAVVRSQAWCLAVMLPGLWWGSTQSVVAIAWVLTGAYALRFAGQVATIVRSGAVGLGDVIVTLRGPVALSALAAVPLTRWVHPSGHALVDEALALALLALAALVLIRLLPRFFVSPACAEVLARLGPGRRLLRALGLHATNR